MIITSANVDRFAKFFHSRIPKETLYAPLHLLQGLPPHLNRVATLPCEYQKFKITAERLLMQS